MTEFYTPQADQRTSQQPVSRREGLADVLLIGDSISQGYTQPVMRLLEGVCNVQRVPENCGDTRRGLAVLDDWLGQTRWALIHFNWGLHDLCHRHPESTNYGHRDKVRGVVSVPLDEYERNLAQLVDRLALRSQRLIWATTTLVPAGEVGRIEGDEVRYNNAAAGVMKARGIAINDLYALTRTFDASMFVGPGDVHLTAAGSARLAQPVAQCIREALSDES